MIKNIKKISFFLFIALFVLNYFKTVSDVKKQKAQLNKNPSPGEDKVESFNEAAELIENDHFQFKTDVEEFERENDKAFYEEF